MTARSLTRIIPEPAEMRRGPIALAGGAGVVAALLAWAGQPGGSAAGSHSSVKLPATSAAPAALSPIRASSAPASGLSHAQPPDPEALREAPARQAVYDAEAQPGEFVTPPSVSIEH